MPRSASKSSGATSGKSPHRSSPRAVTPPAPKRTAEFFHALAVIVLTLVAGLIAMWLTGGSISEYGKSALVATGGTRQIPAGYDTYKCTLQDSGTDPNRSFYAVTTSTSPTGAPTSHFYTYRYYSNNAEKTNLDAPSYGWPSGTWTVRAEMVSIDGSGLPGEADPLDCGTYQFTIAATKAAPDQPNALSVTHNNSPNCTGGGGKTSPIGCTGTNSPTLTYTWDDSTDENNPSYSCYGKISYGVALVRWDPGTPPTGVEIINQGIGATAGSTNTATFSLTGLQNGSYSTSVHAFCWDAGYPFGTPTEGPQLIMNYSVPVPDPGVISWLCNGTNTITLPQGTSTTCELRTANLRSGNMVVIGKGGNDCTITQRQPNATEIQNQVMNFTLTAGTPSCFGPDTLTHHIVANIYDGATVKDTSQNVFISIPPGTTCPNGTCTTLNQVACTPNQTTDTTAWSVCTQSGTNLCIMPIGTCNTSQYCLADANTSTPECNTILYGVSIDTASALNAGTFTGNITAGAWNANPYSYNRCVYWKLEAQNGTTWSTVAENVALDDTSVAISQSTGAATRVRLSTKGFWTDGAALCTVANMTTNWSSVFASGNAGDGTGEWVTREFTGSGSTPSLSAPCTGSFTDGTVVTATIVNDPSNRVSRAEAWSEGLLVGTGIRSGAASTIAVTFNFTSAGFPMATLPNNWHTITYRLFDSANAVLADPAASCTANIQNTVPWDIREVDPVFTCSDNSLSPTDLTPSTTMPVDVYFESGNPTSTGQMARVDIELATDANGSSPAVIGTKATGTNTTDNFGKTYSDVPMAIPASSGATVRRLRFLGYVNSGGTTPSLVTNQTCFVRIQNAGTGVPNATNSTITATAGTCTNSNRAGTVTVTVRDGQTTPALVTGATVTLQAFANATSTTPLTDVTITPASVVTTATGVAAFTVTVPSATARSVVFKATVKSTGNPDITLTSAATSYATCTTCNPTTCAAAGAECGSISNGCGGSLNCGTCSGGQTCQSNQCQDACTATPSLTLSPNAASVAPGATTTFTVTAANVNWTATVTGGGTVTPASGSANATITYTAPAASGSATLTLAGTATGSGCTNPTSRTAAITITAGASCTGTVPANATLCAGDDQGLTASVARHLVASCSANNTNNADRCEYTCSTGFVQQGGVCIPAAPTNLRCDQITQTGLRGNWTAPQTGVQSFRVQLRQGSTVAQSATEPGTSGSHTFNGLTAAVTYTLGVAGLDAAGTAGVEATVQCTTTAPVTPGITMAITESVGTANDGRMLADGTSLATLTCTLRNYAPRSGQTDLNGYTVNFSHTDPQGQVGTLLATTATTNAAGVASVQVRAPSTSGVGDYTCAEPTVPTAASGVIVFSPITPVDFQLALTVPLEGRQATPGGNHGTFATDAMEVRITGTAGSAFAAVTLTNLSTSNSGLVSENITGLVVPDGAKLTVSFKTPQHIRRTVIGTVQDNSLIINLANPATFEEVDTNLRKGKYFLPAGDLTGTKPGETLNDNKVDPSDIGTWIAAFRDEMSCTNAVSTIVEDLNGNCRVGAEDLSLIIRNMNDDGDPLAG